MQSRITGIGDGCSEGCFGLKADVRKIFPNVYFADKAADKSFCRDV